MKNTSIIPTIPSLFRSTFTLVQKNWKELLFITGLPIGLDDLYVPINRLAGNFLAHANIFLVLSYTLITLLLSIVLSVFYIYSIAVTVRYLINSADGSKSIKKAYIEAFHYIFSFIWIVILIDLCVAGASALLIVPGIILFIYLTFALFLVMDGKHKGISVLSASFQLVKGSWWKIFGRTVLISVFGLALVFLVTVIIFPPMYIFAHTSESLVPYGIAHLNILVMSMMIGSWLAGVFSFSYIYSMYVSVKAAQENSVTEEEIKKSNGFFIGLSIWGLVAGVFFFLLMFSITVLSGFETARNQAKSSNFNMMASTSVVVLQQQPYVNNSLGFQMNLPQGWAIQSVNNDPTFLAVYDPTLAYASEISIVSSPNSASGYDLTNPTTQDNFVKLITDSIIKNGGTLLETDRISSTSIKILYNQSGQNQPVSSVLMYFTPDRSYQIATKIEAVDNNQFINALLNASVATFKIIPVTSSAAVTTASNAISQPIGFIPTLNDMYANPDAGFTVKYPAQSDWLWTVTNLDTPQTQQYGILFRDNDTQTFNDESNPHAQIDMNETARPYSNPASLLNLQVSLILSGYKNTTLITQNMTALTPSLPAGFIANTFEVQGGSVINQGATLTPEDGLFMVAVDPAGDLYQFDYRADSEDFKNFYPLAAAVLKSISFTK